MVSFQCRSEQKRASPVNKSTDYANGHQQLEHQGQVDLPDEAFRLKMEAQEGKCFKAFCSHRTMLESLLTPPHGAVAEGAVGEALRVVRWSVLVLLGAS